LELLNICGEVELALGPKEEVIDEGKIFDL